MVEVERKLEIEESQKCVKSQKDEKLWALVAGKL
jgi:hypothetical protein